MSEDSPSRKRIFWKAIKDCTVTKLTTVARSLSPTFEIKIGREITEWYMGLFTNEANSHMSLFLFRKLTDDRKLQFTVNYTFCIIGKYRKHAEFSFRRSSDEFKGIGCGAGHFLLNAKIEESFDELVVDGIFEVCCEISISTWDSPPSSSISKNIQRMYDDELFTDFELRCNDRKILKCHKAILAAQSPVFYAMLSNNMKETQEGFAEVPDFDSVAMNKVLRFIYGFPAGNLDNIASELIFAAEKYDLDDLKQTCIKTIALNLSKENVAQALLISDKVSGSEKLFQECMIIVVGNLSEITKKPAWGGLSNGILTKILHSTAQMISSLKTERIN